MHGSIFLYSCLLGLVTTVASRCGNAGCAIERGFDYKNDNPLNNGATTIVGSPKDCCDLCGNTTGCKKWVMIRVKTRNHKKGECWLKDDNVEKVPCFVCASGNKPKVAVAEQAPVKADADEKCLIFPGVDFKGGDLARGVPTKSDEECCNVCKSLSSCKAWTRVRSSGKCFMKNIQNEVSLCARCSASGIIQSRQSAEDKKKLKSLIELVKDKLDKVENETPQESRLEDVVDNFLKAVQG
ncbi:hypothetical protein BSKO_08949 [Bryopsis sp. KO-2023]|nr:hypothetical protein BSKO_08949 [Bryopsis sp. KO-2023]